MGRRTAIPSYGWAAMLGACAVAGAVLWWVWGSGSAAIGVQGAALDRTVRRTAVGESRDSQPPDVVAPALAAGDTAGQAPTGADHLDTAARSEALSTSLLDSLVPLRARLIEPGTGRPVPFYAVEVFDQHGVSVRARSDRDGLLRSDELLAHGPVRVHARFDAISRPANLPEELHNVTATLRGAGRSADRNADDPPPRERWAVPVRPMVPLDVRALPPSTSRLAAAFTGTQRTASAPLDTIKVADDRLLRRLPLELASHLVPLTVLSTANERSARTAHPLTTQPTLPGRRLHVVAFAEDAVYLASSDTATLPLAGRKPISLVLERLEITDIKVLIERVGHLMARQIAEHQTLVRRRIEALAREAAHPTQRVSGRISSASRAFCGPVRVTATPRGANASSAKRRRASAFARWTLQGDGSSTGTFEIGGLDRGAYTLSFQASGATPITPQQLEIHLPCDDLGTVAVVEDELPSQDLEVVLTDVGGHAAYGARFVVKGTVGDHRFEREVHGAQPPPAEFGRTERPSPQPVFARMPEGATFTVTIERAGMEAIVLRPRDFTSNGRRRIATAVLPD